MAARNPVTPRALKLKDIEKPDRMTMEEIFRDYLGRRNGLRKALTTECQELYDQCDPAYGTLCLIGYPNETWDLKTPLGETLHSHPAPASGINFGRDDENWLYAVALHSDAWLIGVAFYLAARSEFNEDEREKLLKRLNKLTPLSETVREEAKKRAKEKTPKLAFRIKLKRKSEEGPSAPKAKLLKPEQASIGQIDLNKLNEELFDIVEDENDDVSDGEKNNPEV